MDLLYTILALLPSMILICQCTFLKYDPGRHYKYEYETSVIFGQNTHDKDSGKDVGFIINSEFMVELLHDSNEGQLFKLQILSVDVKSIMKPDLQRKLHSLSKFPVLFVLADGMVEKIYTADRDSIFSVNFKKGIVNLFQVDQKVGSRSEIDVSGECTATYSLSGSSGISKTLTDCENIELSGFHKRANPVLGVTVKPVKGFVYQISDGLIDSVTGLNRISATVNLRPNLNAVVSQRQEIKLRQYLKSENQIAATSEEDAVEKISSVVGSSYGMGMLPSTQEVQHCTDKCFSPSTLVSMYKDVLTGDKMASNDSASAFLTLVRGFRNVGKSTLEEVFTSKDGYYIVNQLIDVGVASQTESARHALLDLLNFEDEFNIEYPERYLLATAFTSHPTDALLNNLITLAKKKVPSVELRESILLSLGAVINTYYREEANRKSPILQEYSRLAVDGLAGCGTDQEGCQLMYLRSLGNAGLPSTLQTLLRYSEKGRTVSVSTAAMQALRRFNMEDITHAALPVMQRIFHCTDRQYDIAVRSAALEVLLQLRVSPQDIAAIIRLCTPPVVDVEFSTYVLEKLQDSVKSNDYLRQTVTEALQDTRLNNYNTLAQKGLSSAVSSYLAVTPHVNATYGLYMANSKSGLMRLSSMQVQAFTTDDSLPLLNFGLYADGIDSLLGDEEVTEGGEEGPESNAGMSLTLMDVLLRPVEFFRGSSGLMSAVWNAPSDPVSALQANLLLQDHSERVHLSNGLVVELDVMGAASVDLSGSVSISLWNRNCHSLVTNSGAMLIEGGMRLDSEELTAGITFSAEGGSSIDFSTDVDFYEMPLKMCLQMSRPSFIFSEFYNKFEKHKTLRKNFSVKRKEQVLVNEASFILHKYNARQCRAMDLDQ